MLAFLDGVELYNRPYLHPHCFEKPLAQTQSEIISKVASSIKLAAIGSLAKIHSEPGIYNDAELRDYFSEFDRIARKTNHSFSLLLSSASHSIALHYDSTEASWWVLDANQLPAKRLPAGQMLAQWVKTALLVTGKNIVFESSLYMPANLKLIAQRLQSEISNSAKFKKIHTITKDKANAANHYGVTLAYIAAQNGHADVIRALHDASANLNQPRNDGVTPALIAAYMNHVDVLVVLAQAGIDLTQRTRFGAPLEIARSNNARECITFLQAYTAKKTMLSSLSLMAASSRLFSSASCKQNSDKQKATIYHHCATSFTN